MGDIPITEIEELRNEIKASVTIQSFAGVESGKSQEDKALLNVADKLDEIIEKHDND